MYISIEGREDLSPDYPGLKVGSWIVDTDETEWMVLDMFIRNGNTWIKVTDKLQQINMEQMLAEGAATLTKLAEPIPPKEELVA